MKTVETIGLGTREDLYELLSLMDMEWRSLKHFEYYEDYDPTPWNTVVRGEEREILEVLSELDRRRVHYETTASYPAL